MSKTLELAATVAIFHRQLSTDRAVRFVVQETGVTADAAERALRSVMISYKK
jgi:hypothetical protein